MRAYNHQQASNWRLHRRFSELQLRWSSKYKSEDNIKMDSKEVEWGDVDRSSLIQVGVQ
jgi:hypothetical protein